MTKNSENEARAARAFTALSPYSDDDGFTAMVDLLTDLMHYGEGAFQEALETAYSHYTAELEEE